jgi:capsular polysaccharide biosynthesis protein
LTNETSLESRLVKYFQAEVVHMEDVPFADQVSLANSASVLIGPHGAGLTNLAFMRPGSWIVELIPRRYPVPVFRTLAAEVGQGYISIPGDVHDLQALEWEVDVEAVESVVDRLLRALR